MQKTLPDKRAIGRKQSLNAIQKNIVVDNQYVAICAVLLTVWYMETQ